MGVKTCTKCGEQKALAEFSKDKSRKDGLASACRACRLASTQRWQRNNPDKARRTRQGWVARNPRAYLLMLARHRAKVLGVPFELVLDDIPPIPERCPVLGIPIVHGVGRGRSPNAPSLDRLEPRLGYVPGNVAVVSWRANQVKNDGTADEHARIAAWMRGEPLPSP